MTRKDYIRAAAIVREVRRFNGDTVATTIRDAFAVLFGGDNARFDYVRFVDACERTEV